MSNFFRMFLASCLGTVVGLIILFFSGFFLIAGAISAIGSKDNVDVPKSSVLTLDLGQHFAERLKSNPMGVLNAEETDVPGLYDVLRLIKHAKDDKNISGIYIEADENANGFAASEEIRNAIIDFKKAKNLYMLTEIIFHKAPII